MNELAHYLDRYFAELQVKDTSVVEETELSEDAIHSIDERQERHCTTHRWPFFGRLKRKECYRNMANAGVKV